SRRAGRHGLVVATKGAHFSFSDPEHRPRLADADLRADVEASLRALRLSHIDLWWLHRDDPTRPVAGILAGLESLVKAGLIRWYGASNWSASRLREAAAIAATGDAHGFVADQVLWNAAVLAGPPYGDHTCHWMDED